MQALLVDFHGPDMPATADPVATVLTDAVWLDDDHGRDAGYVVHGDALSTAVLDWLVGHGPQRRQRLQALPAALRRRLVQHPPPEPAPPDGS